MNPPPLQKRRFTFLDPCLYPLRIRQLYDRAVAALRAGDLKLATIFLGAMGHYVGDMAQPFHASLNYDGKVYPTPAAGIHAVFEQGMLKDRAEREFKAHMSPDALLWDNFELTSEGVLASAKDELRAQPLTKKIAKSAIVSETLKLVAGGYPYMEPLLRAFSKECALVTARAKANAAKRGIAQAKHEACVETKDHPASVPVAVIRGFAEEKIENPARGISSMTVMDAAARRMGAASALLARLWVSAYQEAGRPKISNCEEIPFDRATVVGNYLRPEYTPGGALATKPCPRE